MRQIRLQLKALVMLGCFCLCLPSAISGQQLSPQMKKMFEEMLPELDSELQGKLQHAIDQQFDYLELTPDQFKRFRDHPANPFQGWQGIDPDELDGLIRLQFESQPIRSRMPDPMERQAEQELEKYAVLVADANASTVVITDGSKRLALGMIVTDEGHVATKYSEIKDHQELYCRTADGTNYAVTFVGSNEQNDIAVIKFDNTYLPAAELASEWPSPGSILFSTNGKPTPMALGICSNAVRSLVGKNQAFLGVKPINHPKGVEVVEVTRGSSAEAAGVLVGDILLTLNGQALNSVESLVNAIRGNAPGDRVLLTFLRNGESRQLEATLRGRNVGSPSADRFKMMETFGAIPSRRRSEFPMVFQHDTPLLPEDCGGPVTDLEGRIVGMNIARGGRVASYAIPADHVRRLVLEIIRPNVASKPAE